ncbi:MAG: ABC transporter ATP-binding protein [Pseudomonadota bacterium]
MPPALSIQGLSKVYANGLRALNRIDLELAEGDFLALLGPNGAGKSTAIGIVCSLVRKTAGTVRVFGFDLDRDPEAVKACIGLVPQEFNANLFDPVMEILINQAGYYGVSRRTALQRSETILRRLELWDKRASQSRQLSGGMKRRLMIARALVHHPRLLILDEPTAGVDVENRQSMWQFLCETNQAGTTIILTTHYLDEAENLCRELAVIDRGSIIERTTMADLLDKLTSESFVLDLRQPLLEAPALEGFCLTLLGSRSLEVEVAREQSLTALFAALSTLGIEVDSLRNKQNRLERLFLDLLCQSEEAS